MLMRPPLSLFLSLLSVVALPLTAPADNQVVIENGVLRLTFDENTGALTGMMNLRTESEYIQLPSGEPPFVLDVYSANRHIFIDDYVLREFGGFSMFDPDSLEYHPGDLSFLRGGGVKPDFETYSGQPGSRTLRCTYEIQPSLAVSYTVELEDNSPLTVWKIAVDNKPAGHPKDDVRLYRVGFPVIEGLSLGGSHTDDYLARPFAQGQLIPNPVDYSFSNPKHWATRVNVMSYMGWATMPWQDLYDADGGLYLSSYDPSFNQVDFETFPNPEQGTLAMDTRTLAYTEPGHAWNSQEFVVGIHEGDWHWAAETYRSDCRAWIHPVSKPKWVRQSDGWFGTGGPNYTFADLIDMYDDAQWLGLNYLQVWSEMMENVGEDGSRKGYYCFFLPDPDRGGEEELTRAVKEIRSRGGHVGFYSNFWTFDAELPRTLNRVKEKIPDDIPIPRWWGGFRSYASVFPDGSRKAGGYLDDGLGREEQYAGMCPGAEGWQDYLSYWIVDKYVKEYGADTWYLDSFPVTMFGAARTCFSHEHGTAVPHGVNRGFLEFLKKLKDRSYGTVNLAIASETVSDALMPYQSHALGLELLSHLIDYPAPEIYAYSFPEFPIFSGSCNGANVQIYYPGEKVTSEDTMNRVFLFGHRFDILGYPLDRDRPFWQYMKKLIALRQAVKSELYSSHFRDVDGLGTLPSRVEAKIFRHVQGTSLTINLVDRRLSKEPFSLEINQADLDVEDMSECALLTFAGRKRMQLRRTGERLHIEVPALENSVASLVITE